MKKILLVDDKPGTRQATSDILASEGYEVATAADGDAATRMIDGYRPDLILLDIVTPGNGAHGFAEELSGRADTRDIPIVMITPLSAPPPAAGHAVPGVRRLIYKPCRPRTLLEGIDNVLRYGR